MSTPQGHSIHIFVSHSCADNEFGIRLSDDLRGVPGDPTAVWFDAIGAPDLPSQQAFGETK